MANILGQVTIPSSGSVQISTGLANNESPMHFVQQIIFQNKGSNNMRLGDNSVSATRGIILLPTGSANFATGINYGTFLSDWWIHGTPGDVLDFAYVK